MMLVRSTVKYSPIHGLGCFTQENIKKGQVVWKFDPAIDLVYSLEDLKKFPSCFIEFLKMYSYGQINNQEKILILCGDHGRHMNHSDTPNLLEAGDKEGLNIAARDILAGEELTCDYKKFDFDAHTKLNHPL
jgi:SET domain-containing protein